MTIFEENKSNTSSLQRDDIITTLAEYDAAQFIRHQKQITTSIINDITRHSEEFEKQAQSIVLKKYKEEHPDDPSGTKLSSKQILELSEKIEDLTDTLRKKYANGKCNMGNGSLNYCIGLQRHACNEANERIGYKIMPDIGLSCDNARNFFEQRNLGKYYSKISDCFNINNKQVLLDSEGKPKLRDGDLMIVIYPDDNDAFHCLRINVDENNKASYTAGNGEATNGNLSYWAKKNYACYIIPTSQIVTNNAKQYYNSMNRDDLFNIYSTKITHQDSTPNNENTEIASITLQKQLINENNCHNNSSSRIQRINELRGLSPLDRNLCTNAPSLNRPQNQEETRDRIQILQIRKRLLNFHCA